MGTSAAGPTLGGETEGKLQLVLRMPLEKLDGRLTAQPRQGNPVLLGQCRQLPVLAILEVDRQTMFCRHSVSPVSPESMLQTAAVCDTYIACVKGKP